jgi:hypothetical protein
MHSQGEGIITWIQDDPHKLFAAILLASKDRVSTPAIPDVDAMCEARWGNATKHMLEQVPRGDAHRGRLQGFSTVFPSLDGLLFAWARGQDPAAALRALVENRARDGEVIPWAIIGGLYAAIQARRGGHPGDHWESVVRCFLHVVPGDPMSEDRPAPIPARREIERQGREWDGRPGSVPANPYARALFLWEAGRLSLEGPWGDIVDTDLLGEAVLLAQPRPWRVDAGPAGYLELDEGGDFLQLLFTAKLLWEHPVGAEALAFILPNRLVRPQGEYPIEEPADLLWETEIRSLVPEDQEMVCAWAGEMVREAGEGAAYVPIGAFRVPVPEGAILRAWGIDELRLYIEPAAPGVLWAGIGAPDGRVVGILRWQPEGSAGERIVSSGIPPWALPSVDLFCASLWRDLRQAGPVVFPAPSRRRGRRKARTETPSDAVVPPSGPPVRTLPRRRVAGKARDWTLRGERRVWGTPEERRRIQQRRAAFVSGHYRRVGVYAAECRACALRAASEDPPTDDWRERLRKARAFGDEEEATWWQALLSATGSARGEEDEGKRLELVESVLEGLLRRHPGKAELCRWAERGLEAIGLARGAGIAEVLGRAEEELGEAREGAAERAVRWGALPPPARYTFVKPHVAGGVPGESAEAPVVRAKGLFVVEAVLRGERGQ